MYVEACFVHHVCDETTRSLFFIRNGELWRCKENIAGEFHLSSSSKVEEIPEDEVLIDRIKRLIGRIPEHLEIGSYLIPD